MAPLMLVLLWIAARVTAQLCGSPQVLELDDSTFNAAISQCHHILVDFYAPWCSHCKALSPQLDKVASSLPQLTVAKINADKYTSISSKYKISEYPTIKLFIDSVEINYDGPHKAELMLAHLKKIMAPELTYLSAPSDVDSFLHQAGIHFPIFIAFGLQSSTSFVQHLARKHHGRAWFGVFNVEDSNSGDIMATYGFHHLPALLVHHPGQQDDDRQVFYGPFQGDSLTKFVKHSLLPALTNLTYDSLKAVKDDGRPILVVITNTSSSPELHQLTALARSHVDFVFALLNSSSWPVLADNFNDQKLLIWTGQSEFYTSFAEHDSEEHALTEQIVNLVRDFRNNKAKRNLVKRPPLFEQVADFLGQNFLYVILFIVTVVVSLQGMSWSEPRPTNLT